jgi:hypothetical protein
MSNILDLIQFDEIKIEKKKDWYSYRYTATLQKFVVFQSLDKRLISIEQFEAESKKYIILQILSGAILEKCDDSNREYFTQLKNEMENMPEEVDAYLWSIGLKKREQ